VGLRDKGFNEVEIEKIIGRNWLDFCAAGFGPQ
jgi:microsomal dipeptidase-like Zn-dependent dipeptidase